MKILKKGIQVLALTLLLTLSGYSLVNLYSNINNEQAVDIKQKAKTN